MPARRSGFQARVTWRLFVFFRARLAIAVLLALPVLGAHAADEVRLGNLKFAHYGAVSYMKELGPKFGLNITEHVFAKGIDIVPALLSGDVDLGASAVDGAISARAAGAPVYIVAGFAKGGARIVGRKDLAIKSISGLKGKKVGVARGGAHEILLIAELAKAGLTWGPSSDKDVQILYLAYADLNQALEAKQIDAMSQSEPQAAQAIAKGFGSEILRPYDTAMGEPSRALVMTEKMYKERPDVARRILECFVASTRKFLDDPQLAEKYVREQMFKNQLSHEDYQGAMSNASFTYDITAEHVQTTADLMIKYGVGRLPAALKATDFVKLDLLTKAKAALGVK
jgi:NitT/TauT family transport system substrate-binding protein